MAEAAVFDSQAVLAAVSPAEAIERTRAAFERHASGDWVMPAKVYVDAPPDGDFRAMPARGDGLATLKWVTSFPANPRPRACRWSPARCSSPARETGELLAIMDCAAITSLRTGAAAAVSALTLARDGRPHGRGDRLRRQRRLGGPLPGGRRLRAGRVLRPAAGGGARRSPPSSAGAPATREAAAAADVVVTVTPADEPVIAAADLRAGPAPGGARRRRARQGRGRARRRSARCRLFCDEWEQASKGGELSGPVGAGTVGREDVTEIGDVLLDRAPGRSDADEITLFDSTGLAIQDLGIALAVLEAHREGRVEAATVAL